MHTGLAFNKVFDVADFSDPDLKYLIGSIFAHDIDNIEDRFDNGYFDRKYWEIAMSVRALRHFDKLHDKSLILGVGAGTEITSFYLANHAKRVYATDMYLSPGEWGADDYAPKTMMSSPQAHSPFPYREDHLIVQHMDGCQLGYPDDMFDGIYSSSSIEHFGSLDAIGRAAAEMGRVLKLGGILTLSTEYKIAGDGDGWVPSNTLILSRDRIDEFIIDASGLELVDEIDFELSDETMKYRRDMEAIIASRKEHPNILIAHEGYTFCSIHLTLRKVKS